MAGFMWISENSHQNTDGGLDTFLDAVYFIIVVRSICIPLVLRSLTCNLDHLDGRIWRLLAQEHRRQGGHYSHHRCSDRACPIRDFDLT